MSFFFIFCVDKFDSHIGNLIGMHVCVFSCDSWFSETSEVL
uniref:Uncharacterized protein n=1 Tax=Rhizophora mucronata TaxID=61149 RepID=A0A2P2NYZ3_RHIMU